jgi:tetratricopeptide (TPR) repeat protein
MIVRNEEHNLSACLAAVAGLVDDMVLVDTGSTDGTVALAQSWGARVFTFPWVDSFAAARNEALRHVTGDWVFWLDADDRLDAANQDRLRLQLTQLPDELAGFTMRCLYPAEPGHTTVVDQVRLFRHHPQLQWQHRVHEQILPSLRSLGARLYRSAVTIHHVGFLDRAVRERKVERNLRLLQLEVQEQPEHPFTLFNLATVYQEQGKWAEAETLLQRCLLHSGSGDLLRKLAYARLARCQRHLGQLSTALATCHEGRRHYPVDASLLFQESLLQRQLGNRAGAEACLQQLLHGPRDPACTSEEAGLRSYQAQHGLASLYFEQRRFSEAEQHWRTAVSEQPDYLPAWLGLAEALLAQEQWAAVEPVLQRLDRELSLSLAAGVLRARVQLAHRDFTGARARLEQLMVQYPRALPPRLVLSHVLLKEGRDRTAAERVLRGILRLVPGHREAQHNLKLLQSVPAERPPGKRQRRKHRRSP